MPTNDVAKFDWSIFNTGKDISRIAIEFAQKVKLLKNDTLLYSLIHVFLMNSKHEIEKEGQKLTEKYAEINSFAKEVEGLVDPVLKGILSRELESRTIIYNKDAERYKLKDEDHRSIVDLYGKHKEEILVKVREFINQQVPETGPVNLCKITLYEMLHTLSNNGNNPAHEKITQLVIERILQTYPDSSQTVKLDFYSTEDRNKLTPEWAIELKQKYEEGLMVNSTQDDPYFDLLFAYAIRQTSIQQLKDFLEYQQHQYEGDYTEFVKLCLLEHESLINQNHRNIIDDWIKNTNNTKENCIEIKKPKIKRRTKQDTFTSLSADQTAYLIHHLKALKIFINDKNILSNSELAKAIFVLTGYSSESIRQAMIRLETKNNEKDIIVIQKKLHQINKLINKDLQAIDQ